MKINLMKGLTLVLLLCATSGPADSADEMRREAGRKNPLRDVYFGEQHLHTQNSWDAYLFGTRNNLDDAYKFAKGLPVEKRTVCGLRVEKATVRKNTAYDWVAVTDHAEFLGILPMFFDKDNPLHDTWIGKRVASVDVREKEAILEEFIRSAGGDERALEAILQKSTQSAWERQKAAANNHNDPGHFTTFIAFEWTSLPGHQNLHHNVFFRDDEGPDVIFSMFDSVKREDLWTYQEVQRSLGHENFSIPHNSNLSNSMMFPPRTSYGTAITRQWANRSVANTVATEILQTKGASETHPALSPNDEFADFEMTYNHLLGSKAVGKIDFSFVRRGLIDGVGLEEKLGANPYKFGIVAGADSHTAFSVNEEDNYTGVAGKTDNTAKKRLLPQMRDCPAPKKDDVQEPKDYGTTGATGVWAEENTREAIFDAIKRKETFGTSGPLIRLRFFGGWNYRHELVKRKHFLERAYALGVPMGSDLPKKPTEVRAPKFVVEALQDPKSGKLDRIQIVKGWYENGYPQERVFDVVGSDGRKLDKDGHLPPVRNTVDINNPSISESDDVGDAQLTAVWEDPEFDPSLYALYYARVLEVHTPRWSTYDAKELGILPPSGVHATIQERAWSSPIWYIPDSALVKKQRFYPGLEQFLP